MQADAGGSPGRGCSGSEVRRGRLGAGGRATRSPAPSRSRNDDAFGAAGFHRQSGHGEGSRGSSGPSDSDDSHKATFDSQAMSDLVIPDAVHEDDWSGMGTVYLPKCEHRRHAALKKCYGGKNTGRRFLGCPIQAEEEQCQFVQWVDEEWLNRATNSLKKLWTELKATRHAKDLAKDVLHDAMQMTEQALNAKVAMEAEVQNTKRVARRVCTAYQKKALVIAMDKSKLMYLTWCLMVLILALLAVLLFLRN